MVQSAPRDKADTMTRLREGVSDGLGALKLVRLAVGIDG